MHKIRTTGRFEVTDEHLTLMLHLNIDWQDMEFGAPAVDPKRPYGNSDVIGNIAELLGFEVDSEDEQWFEDHWDALTLLHAETGVALQISVATGQFKAGWYRLGNNYDDTSWQWMAEQ